MATSPKRLATGGSADWADNFELEGFLGKWGNALIATARRYSPSAVDADDVYQRAVEKLLTSFPDCESEEHLVAWMHTVIRNEALQIHRASSRVIDGEFERLAETLVAVEPLPEESAVSSEELAWGREALGRIRPDQTRCLLLKAEGMSNPEICETTGFSYAKVNRLLSEGRKALSNRAFAIEGGKECQRIEPFLLLIADESASAEVIADANLHLEHCSMCKATLRDLRGAPESLKSILPLGTALPASDPSVWSRISDQIQSWVASLQERLFGPVVAQSSEVVVAKKLAVAASLAIALVGGGIVAERNIDDRTTRAAAIAVESAGISRTLSAVDLALDPESDAESRRATRTQDASAADAARVIESNAELDVPRSAADEPQDESVSGDPLDNVPAGAPEDTGIGVEGLAP